VQSPVNGGPDCREEDVQVTGKIEFEAAAAGVEPGWLMVSSLILDP